MFKVSYINGDSIDTTTKASSVLGKALHEALRVYFGGNPDIPTPADDGEAIKLAHDEGLKYLNAYSDGMIDWSSTIPDRAKMSERYAFAFFGYIKGLDIAKDSDVLIAEKMLKHKVSVDGKELPIPLKGSADLVTKKDSKIRIIDHKFVSKFSNDDEIDGSKLIQAAFLYFLVSAETGENPESITFREFKITPNQDKSPQTREYCIVYSETPLLFDLFYRLYDDITDALMGKQVFIPNIMAMFDREVSILAYIHRLDVESEKIERLKKMKVDNITDFLKKKIQKAGAMKKYLEVVAKKFISATTLNYKEMTVEERIKMKLAEHGLAVEFDSRVDGYSVTLYRYMPSVGLKMSKLENYVKDVEQVVSISGIRVLAPIPDSELIGFEVPKKDRTFPTETPVADGFSLALGIDIMGGIARMDIRNAPHMLVAGATGSGKSVFVSQLIKQIHTIPNTELVLLDPKLVELSHFKSWGFYADGIEEINSKLFDLVDEMNDRYKKMQKKGVRNIEEYNTGKSKLPYIFCFIDEYGDLVMQNYVVKNEEEKVNLSEMIRQSVLLLAQKARAAGIHIILTAQRPSVKVVDGVIKANFPTRVAFKTSTEIDSKVILDQGGAEKLLGKGDMLVMENGRNSLQRLQGFNS